MFLLLSKQDGWLRKYQVQDLVDYGDPCHTALDSFIDKGGFNINRAYNSFLPQLPKVAWKKLTMAK
ncbi:hypothetical protein KY290_022171 [Solanum tuberosum]|uniref:Uncharacterized protein n=1 Tax=Solanum tuberosum TaxID=4113 RepID=A0ABQ7V5N9_SOLTU|nr:hypothetical protein KY289_021300 [Solanum tuberosum]KAH0758678.1 hypothetical protein KY290_022171 [Solanum tuberosum]